MPSKLELRWPALFDSHLFPMFRRPELPGVIIESAVSEHVGIFHLFIFLVYVRSWCMYNC